MRKLYERAKRLAVKKLAERKWESLPKGWDRESLKSFWDTLTDETPAGEGGVRKCIKKISSVYPEIDNPEAFCASAADVLFPGWRAKAARERRRRRG